MTDYGPEPFATNIEDTTLSNRAFRDTLWTGKYLQLTVMNIPPGGVVGGEIHDDHDQFIRVESGRAQVVMGASADELSFDETVGDDWIALIPAGKYHNIVNIGDDDLKLYSLYGPAEHHHGTRHETFADAVADPQETDLV